MSKRERFNRAAIIGSSDSYKRAAHIRYIREEHIKNYDELMKLLQRLPNHIVDYVNITKSELVVTEEKVTVKHYYVRCFGKLIEVTEREAMMLRNTVEILKDK